MMKSCQSCWVTSMVGWAPWAGRDIDVNGQDVQETRSRTYLRTLRHATRDGATRDWLSAVLKISVVMEFGRSWEIWPLSCSVDEILSTLILADLYRRWHLIYLADHFWL